MNENKEAKLLAAGTKIHFKNADADNFGCLTVVNGILDIVYFDGTTALVKMGRFPVLSAELVTDSWIIIGDTNLEVEMENIELRSRTNHTHWSEKSCWQ